MNRPEVARGTTRSGKDSTIPPDLRGKEVLLTVLFPPQPITLSDPPIVPGPDIWDRSTCPWESFSEEGLSSPDDTHGNTCHT